MGHTLRAPTTDCETRETLRLSADTEFARQRRAREARVAELLETLASLGQARRLDDGRYIA